MITLQHLLEFLDNHLEPRNFKDVAINGLQVEGRKSVQRVLCGVSSCQALFEEALRIDADAVLVHHGIFWGQPKAITGGYGKRIRTLLAGDISLVAYHLPLDAHQTDGNNARLAAALGLTEVEPWGEYHGQSIGCLGTIPKGRALEELVGLLNAACQADAFVLGREPEKLERAAIVSGGAGSMLEQAIEAGADLFVTGEPGEPAQEIAREAGVTVLGAGHYNTERLGVQALAARLAAELDLETSFFDVPNPI